MNMSFEKGKLRLTIAEEIDAGRLVSVNDVTHKFLAEYSDIPGADMDFYTGVAFEHFKAMAKTLVGKWQPNDITPSDQMIFEGFEHLQKAYPVERHSVRVLVPIDQLTDAEWDAKESELKTMSDGCLAHLREIAAYRAQKPEELNSA